MELLNVGRRGRDKVTRLEHGVQTERPQVCRVPELACIHDALKNLSFTVSGAFTMLGTELGVFVLVWRVWQKLNTV